MKSTRLFIAGLTVALGTSACSQLNDMGVADIASTDMVGGLPSTDIGGMDVDVGTAVDAGGDLLKAATLSESETKALSLKTVKSFDQKNAVLPASSNYAKRLARITRNLREVDGLKINYKIYRNSEINAFAMPDGSVRVYTGLMDYMNDNEILGVIGHEIGHVKLGHGHRKMQVAYAASGVRKGVASSGSTAGVVASSQLGGLMEMVLNSQFSQSQETDADEYSLELLYQNGYDPSAAVDAMRALARHEKEETGKGSGFSLTSTHPAPGSRVENLQEMLTKLEKNPPKKRPTAVASRPAAKQDRVVDARSTAGRKPRTVTPTGANLQRASLRTPVRSQWFLQVRALDNALDAEDLSRQLQARSLNAHVERAVVYGREYHRVLVGPFVSKSAALTSKSAAQSALGPNISPEDEPFLRKR